PYEPCLRPLRFIWSFRETNDTSSKSGSAFDNRGPRESAADRLRIWSWHDACALLFKSVQWPVSDRIANRRGVSRLQWRFHPVQKLRDWRRDRMESQSAQLCRLSTLSPNFLGLQWNVGAAPLQARGRRAFGRYWS